MTHQMGWHWLANNRELQYCSDGRVLGTYDTIHVPGTPVLCQSGLHWSSRIIDSLKYSPGNIICRVESWGDTVHGNDKSSSEYRQIRWWIDAEMVLWSWLCDICEKALRGLNAYNNESMAAINLRREWLDGKVVKDQEWAAARDTARDAAWVAAWDAARAAAWAAARAAAWDGAWDGAWDAARDAAWDAEWVAARDAAWDTARDAAWVAAWDAQNKPLESAIRAEARRLNIANWEE